MKKKEQTRVQYLRSIVLRCIRREALSRWPKTQLKIVQEEDEDTFIVFGSKNEQLCCLKHIVSLTAGRNYWAIEKGSYSTFYKNIEDVSKGFEAHITDTYGIKREPKAQQIAAIPPPVKKIVAGKKNARKCSVCKQPGHNKRTCPQRNEN